MSAVRRSLHWKTEQVENPVVDAVVRRAPAVGEPALIAPFDVTKASRRTIIPLRGRASMRPAAWNFAIVWADHWT
jgi:hypothetical protein